MFAASVILLAEKFFLRFVAIRFHQKALADRLAENRLALKALDRLSNAQPTALRKSMYMGAIGGRKKGHKSQNTSEDVMNKESRMDVMNASYNDSSKAKMSASDKKKRKKAVTSMIVDQLGDVIGQVALKDSKFNRGGELTGLHSARRLARQLFSTLSDVHPPRNHLLVEGTSTHVLPSPALIVLYTDFYPYFPSTAEAVCSTFNILHRDTHCQIDSRFHCF